MNHLFDTFFVLGAAFAAGCIDAIAGGGGLIQLPALFGVYPSAEPTSLLGTNKFASVFGTSNAVWRYSRRITIHWRALVWLMLLVLFSSAAGALLAKHISPERYRLLVPVMLVIVLAIVLHQRHLGAEHRPRDFTPHYKWMATALIALIGLYDGFFGPGTGSFFMFVFVRVYGYDFLNAAANARVLNVITNIAAIIMFADTTHIMWLLGGAMAISNVAGSMLGAAMALNGGNALIRKVFVAIVIALIARTLWTAFA